MHTRTVIRRVKLVSLMLLLVSASIGKAQDIPRLSVCEVLKDFQTFSGKLIAVHGEV